MPGDLAASVLQSVPVRANDRKQAVAVGQPHDLPLSQGAHQPPGFPAVTHAESVRQPVAAGIAVQPFRRGQREKAQVVPPGQKGCMPRGTDPVKRLQHVVPCPAKQVQRGVQPVNGAAVVGLTVCVQLLKLPHGLMMRQPVAQLTDAAELCLQLVPSGARRPGREYVTEQVRSQQRAVSRLLILFRQQGGPESEIQAGNNAPRRFLLPCIPDPFCHLSDGLLLPRGEVKNR